MKVQNIINSIPFRAIERVDFSKLTKNDVLETSGVYKIPSNAKISDMPLDKGFLMLGNPLIPYYNNILDDISEQTGYSRNWHLSNLALHGDTFVEDCSKKESTGFVITNLEILPFMDSYIKLVNNVITAVKNLQRKEWLLSRVLFFLPRENALLPAVNVTVSRAGDSFADIMLKNATNTISADDFEKKYGALNDIIKEENKL